MPGLMVEAACDDILFPVNPLCAEVVIRILQIISQAVGILACAQPEGHRIAAIRGTAEVQDVDARRNMCRIYNLLSLDRSLRSLCRKVALVVCMGYHTVLKQDAARPLVGFR